MALRRATRIAFGKKKQTAINTPQTAADMWSFTKLNGSVLARPLTIEDDSQEFGKGHEFAINRYATAYDVSGEISKYLSSELACWLWNFALGSTTVTGAGPYVYTSVPVSSGSSLALPLFCFVQQTAGTDEDSMAVDCVLNSFQITQNYGPGRQNSQFQAQFVGSGLLVEPSGITMPAFTTETLLPAGLMALTALAVNYVSLKDIISITYGWNNNIRLDTGFFPGSDFQTSGDPTSGAIRGRMEFGDRSFNMSITARKSSTSSEYAKSKAGTTGTIVLNLTANANNSSIVTVQKASYGTPQEGDVNGIASVTTPVIALYDSTNGLISAVNKCGVAQIAA